MVHDSADVSVGSPAEAHTLDLTLKSLWDKVRRAAEVIARLRVENSQLQSTVGRMQQELSQQKEDLIKREQEIRKLSAEKTEIQSARTSGFSNGEREALSARVKELLGKIESYL